MLHTRTSSKKLSFILYFISSTSYLFANYSYCGPILLAVVIVCPDFPTWCILSGKVVLAYIYICTATTGINIFSIALRCVYFFSVVGSDYAGWCRVSGSAGLRLIWRLLAPVLSQGTQDQAGPTLTLRSVSKMPLDKHLDLVFNVLRGNLCPLGALGSCFPKGP